VEAEMNPLSAPCAGMMNPPTFILLHPQLGENIGAVARAMSNFGLSDLRIVAPRDGWPNPQANAMAAHGEHIIQKAIVVDRLKDALTDITTLYATTPRTDVLNKPVLTPREVILLMEKLRDCESADERAFSSRSDAPCDFQKKITGANKRSAILFGPERIGLMNEDIVLADAIISIPVSDENPSLNIAQAAVVIAYEWYVHRHPGVDRDLCRAAGALPEYVTDGGSLLSSSVLKDVDPGLRRDDNTATKAELEGLFEHAKILLDNVNYFRDPNKARLMWQHMRNIWVRSNLTSQEVRTLRGLIRAILRQMKND
jgi:tRNA/rRNA methyltransferase